MIAMHKWVRCFVCSKILGITTTNIKVVSVLCEECMNTHPDMWRGIDCTQ